MWTTLYNRYSTSPLVTKEKKPTIITGTAVLGGISATGILSYLAWWRWIKKPQVDAIKKDLCAAEAEYESIKKIQTHLDIYLQHLKQLRIHRVPKIDEVHLVDQQLTPRIHMSRNKKIIYENEWNQHIEEDLEAKEIVQDIKEIAAQIKLAIRKNKEIIQRIQSYRARLGKNSTDLRPLELRKIPYFEEYTKKYQAQIHVHRGKVIEDTKPKSDIKSWYSNSRI